MELLPAIESIDDAFAESVRLHADRPALSSRGKIFSYAELARLVDETAVRISAACGPGAGPVAIRMAHDLPAVAAALGAIRAGRIFMPLDASVPDADLRGLLAHAGAVALVTDTDVARLDPVSPVSREEADGCACIYYSSGSTGRPKGIALPHRAVLHATKNYVSALGVTPEDRVALLGSLGFGASMTTMFGALLSGACLCLHDVRGGDIDSLKRWLRDERISIYQSVTTLFRHFASSLWHGDSFPALRVIKLGGEPVSKSDVALFQRHLAPGRRLVNGLGITEAGGNVCFFTLDRDLPAGSAMMPVGYAVDGVEILVTDAGELVLRSRFLAFGYWRKPAPTRDAFRRVPGSDDLVEYRTGDRVQKNPDGCIEFLGRRDGRVKIRGFMVDLHDVEARVRSVTGVTEAAVVSTDRAGETLLTAFVVSDMPHPPSPRDALRAVLPDYAIPARFVTLPALPLTPSGKVDRAALSALASAQADTQRVSVAPRDALELQLKLIWERALELDDIGVTDNFFDLGGHSIKALTVSSLASKAFGVELPLAALTRHPTIESLANLLRDKGWAAQTSPAVLLKAGGTNPPLFCVPGAGSDVFALFALARHLEDRPVYGLQHQGIDGDVQRHRSVEHMAAHYVEHLERIQPDGPFHLAGTSFGGVVAYELARQLMARGRSVAFLGLLDAYGSGYPKLRGDLSLRRRLLVLLRWFLPIGNKAELTRANLRAGVKERWGRIKAGLDLALRVRNVPPPMDQRFFYLMGVCFRAREHYSYPRFDGKIILFRAMTQPTEILYARDPELGWHGCARDGVEVHDVPGRHSYHLREPNVATLATAMLACMSAEANPDRS